MSTTLGQRFGFDAEGIAKRLALTGLTDGGDDRLIELLQHEVIEPHVDSITDAFANTMAEDPAFLRIVEQHSSVERLKTTLKRYLLAMGRDFGSARYFEDRLAVGAVHQRVGVSLSRYHCAYRLLQGLLIGRIPDEIKRDTAAFESLVQLIVKLTALDMSLAIDAYHGDKLVSLERSIDTIRHEGDELRRSLRTDSLTGLASRQYALERLRLALASARDHELPPCVVMADLDHFKAINDSLGHLVGDRVLQAVAKRVMAGAREHDIIGRYGGEEFIMVLENTAIEDAERLAERMRKNVGRDPINTPDASVQMTISMGIAAAREDEAAESVTGRADRMLYAAKLAGRDCVRVDKPDPGEQKPRHS